MEYNGRLWKIIEEKRALMKREYSKGACRTWG
jgi:hypothetical protein